MRPFIYTISGRLVNPRALTFSTRVVAPVTLKRSLIRIPTIQMMSPPESKKGTRLRLSLGTFLPMK